MRIPRLLGRKQTSGTASQKDRLYSERSAAPIPTGLTERSEGKSEVGMRIPTLSVGTSIIGK